MYQPRRLVCHKSKTDVSSWTEAQKVGHPGIGVDEVERRLAVRLLRARAGAGCEEQPCDFEPPLDLVRAPGRGRMQRRLPEPCAGLDIGAAGQQYLDDGGLPLNAAVCSGRSSSSFRASMSAPAAISSSYPLLGMQVLLV
ncbi:MAG TPA: hypothetical protein VHJ58_12450 [Vicinamibacterales bacterium]|nr:hypothetical protein [Vicinamibacterales bacterium]